MELDRELPDLKLHRSGGFQFTVLELLMRDTLKRFPLILIVILCLMFPSTIQAQFKMAIGPVFGGNVNVHTGAALQKTGTGVGFVIGGQAELSFTKSLGALATVNFYDNRIGSFTHTFDTLGVAYSADESETVVYLDIEPLFKFTLPDVPLYVVAGASVGFSIQGKSEATTTIMTPGYSFPDGTDNLLVKTDIRNVNTRYELKVGCGYIYTVDKRTHLNFQFLYSYGLNKVTSDQDWKIMSFGLTAAFEFTLGQ